MSNLTRIFTVDGKPFFPVGGQARNSSGYNEREWETAFRGLEAIGGNTLEVPIYWDQVEPEEGQFDFSSLDALLARARRAGVRLVLLWFGAWKNGDMDYAPAWVKTNPARFRRAITPTGKACWGLSPHCPANFEADRRAFTELCRHLRTADEAARTVIALQVENEPGMLGSDRDYGPEAQACFESLAPAGLVERMRAAGRGQVYELWQAAGGRERGDWGELFGWAGGELMTAYSIATYIDAVAAAGKAAYDLPMYVNVWLGEGGWRVPGESYPSGGAVGKTLDLYKWFAPHIDLIAPDIYVADARGYEAMCRLYARDDNPLFVPESGPGGSNAWLLFRAVADYNAIGYAFFGIEHVCGPDGAVAPGARELVESMRCLAAALPLVLAYQGTGKLHAIVQEEQMGEQAVALEGWRGLAAFGLPGRASVPTDWRHPSTHIGLLQEKGTAGRGRGLVVQASRNEFYLVGSGYRLELRPLLPPAQALDVTVAAPHLLRCQTHYVSVDEGHFDAGGGFVVDRRRNGDEVDGGIWVEADTGVVRARLTE